MCSVPGKPQNVCEVYTLNAYHLVLRIISLFPQKLLYVLSAMGSVCGSDDDDDDDDNNNNSSSNTSEGYRD